MTLAYWCIFILIFVPWVCAGYGKWITGFTGKDNHNPRAFMQKQEGVAARANAAQMNSYEIFPVFAAMVIIAHVTGNASQSMINFWAVVFVLSRIAFCYCYIKDLATLRSLVWGVGLVAIIALFVIAI